MLDLYTGRIAHYNAIMNSLSIYLHHIDTTDSVDTLREKVEHNNKIIEDIEKNELPDQQVLHSPS